jgi:hypothetical protein
MKCSIDRIEQASVAFPTTKSEILILLLSPPCLGDTSGGFQACATELRLLLVCWTS